MFGRRSWKQRLFGAVRNRTYRGIASRFAPLADGQCPSNSKIYHSFPMFYIPIAPLGLCWSGLLPNLQSGQVVIRRVRPLLVIVENSDSQLLRRFLTLDLSTSNLRYM